MPELEPLLPESLPVAPEEKAAPITVTGVFKKYVYTYLYIFQYNLAML